MKKISTRFLACILAAFMALGTAVPAFAAEIAPSDNVSVASETPEAEVMPLMVQDGGGAYLTVGSRQSGVEYATLDPYVGLYKKFVVTTGTSITTSGLVSVVLTRASDGKDMGSWGLSTEKREASQTFWLPTSGEYKLLVYNNTGSTVAVLGYWE